MKEPHLSSGLAKFLSVVKPLLEIIPDGVVIIEPSGRTVYANPSAIRMLSLPKEELLGSPTEKINPLGWA
jgi:PAS domain-containing protein